MLACIFVSALYVTILELGFSFFHITLSLARILTKSVVFKKVFKKRYIYIYMHNMLYVTAVESKQRNICVGMF